MARKGRKSKAKKPPKTPEHARAEELVDFLQDVALGKREATTNECEEAMAELDKYLPEAGQKDGKNGP
jgi:hypothetical protein